MRLPTPLLPNFVLTQMSVTRNSDGYYDKNHGGQWVDGTTEKIGFMGALFPLSNEDLKTGAAQGWYTQDQQKIYTNGFALLIGDKVTTEGKEFLVNNELTHSYHSPIKVYIVTRKGVVQK